MKLRRVVNCTRNLSWETALPAGLDVATLVDAFEEQTGGTRAASLPGLLQIAAQGHTVVFAVRSGRVQIRLAYTTPDEQRSRAAETIFAQLVRTALGQR